MYHVILDTDIWVFLAQDVFPDALPQLENLVESNKAIIILPEQVKEEWFNGKSELVRTHYKNNIKGALSNSKKLKDYLSGEEKEVLSGLIESVSGKKDEYAVVKSEEYISRVEKLILSGETIPTTDNSKIKATEMGLAKKAPFHKKNNSFGDALIALSTVEYLQKNEIKNAYFITGNKTDFSKVGKESEIHPDLKELFDSVELHYSINVKEVFRTIDDMIVTKEEVQEVERINRTMYTLEPPECPECQKNMGGTYLRSQYGGLTWQWFCSSCHHRIDTGEFWD